MTKEVSTIIAEIKAHRSARIVQTMQSATSRLDKCTAELSTILNNSREWDWDLPEKFRCAVGTYMDSITIADASDKEAYNNMLLCLVDMYGDGKRDALHDDSIQYTWNTKPTDYWNGITVYLQVKSAISGCVIVKKRVYVPRKEVPRTVTEAHYTEKNVLECIPE